jgi:hypothetical protein
MLTNQRLGKTSVYRGLTIQPDLQNRYTGDNKKRSIHGHAPVSLIGVISFWKDGVLVDSYQYNILQSRIRLNKVATV